MPSTIYDHLSARAATIGLVTTIVCAVVGLLIFIPVVKSKIKPTARPASATEIPSLEPMKQAGKEIFFLVLFIVIGSLAIFGIYMAIVFG